ncbi:hypothetical protein QTN25_006511 [Entamoeba marina]
MSKGDTILTKSKTNTKIVEEQQLYAYKNYVNFVLAEEPFIEDITQDLQDGTILIRVLQNMSGKIVPLTKMNPTKDIEKIQNLSSIVQFMKDEGIKITGSAEEIFQGDQKIILSVLFQILNRYRLGECPVKMTDFSKWIRSVLNVGDVNGFDLKQELSKGVVFAKMLNYLESGVVNLDTLGDDNLKIIQLCVDTAHDKFNIPKLIIPEYILNQQIDNNCLYLYLTFFILKETNFEDNEILRDIVAGILRQSFRSRISSSLHKTSSSVKSINSKWGDNENELYPDEAARLQTLSGSVQTVLVDFEKSSTPAGFDDITFDMKEDPVMKELREYQVIATNLEKELTNLNSTINRKKRKTMSSTMMSTMLGKKSNEITAEPSFLDYVSGDKSVKRRSMKFEPHKKNRSLSIQETHEVPETDLKSLQEKCNKLEQQLKEKTQQLELKEKETNEKTIQHNQEIEQTRNTNSSNLQKISELEQELKKQQDESKELQQKLEQKETSLESIQNEQHDLKLSLKKLEDELIHQKELTSEIQNKSNKQEIENGELSSLINEKEQIINSLQQQLNDEKNAVGSLQKDLDELTKQSEQQKTENEQLKEENNKKKEEINKLEEESNNRNEEINQLKELNEKLKEENNQKNEEINQLKEATEQLKEESDKKNEEINHLKDENNQKNEELNQLKEATNKKNEEINQLKELTEQLKEENNQKNEELNQLKEATEQLKEESDKKNAELNQLKELTEQLKEENSNKKDELNQLEKENNNKNEEINQLKELNEQLKEESNKKNEEINQLRELIEELKEKNQKN